VTGVDGRNRALIEAGRALKLDFAAPGADMASAGLGGKMVGVRGTSYAVPLVAGLVQRARGNPAALASSAVDLGKKGPDPLYGKGLVCGECRTVWQK
jgi:minor extracellular protease Epr